MHLTSGQIRYLIRTLNPPLIEPLPCPEGEDPEEYRLAWQTRCNWIEGCLFDLTLDKLLWPRGNGEIPHIGDQNRNLPEWQGKSSSDYKLYAWDNARHLVHTQETINMPKWISGYIWQRYSFIAAGAHEPCTRVAPGFSGQIKHGLDAAYGLSLERGTRTVGIEFQAYYVPDVYRNIHDYVDEIDVYSGIWGGSKTDTGGKTERGY